MGGNVFKNVVPVRKDLVEPTVQSLISRLGIERSRIALLGSAGKKPVSGDIDIAIDLDAEGQKALFQQLKQEINDHDVRKVGGNISVPWHIHDTSEYVQIDFIFGNIKWLEFFYHSPANSKLKGAHRNVAISSLAGHTDRVEVSNEYTESGQCAHVKRWKWSSRDGLVYVEREHAVNQKTGKFVKKAKETILSEKMRSPKSVAHILFKGKLSDKYLDSAESVIEAVSKLYTKSEASKIFERMAINFCEHHDLRKHSWEYPAEIKYFVDKIAEDKELS